MQMTTFLSSTTTSNFDSNTGFSNLGYMYPQDYAESTKQSVSKSRLKFSCLRISRVPVTYLQQCYNYSESRYGKIISLATVVFGGHPWWSDFILVVQIFCHWVTLDPLTLTKRPFTLSSIELGSISDRSRFALREPLFKVVYKIDLMQTREVNLMQIDL